jgi:hypothetical protein
VRYRERLKISPTSNWKRLLLDEDIAMGGVEAARGRARRQRCPEEDQAEHDQGYHGSNVVKRGSCGRRAARK